MLAISDAALPAPQTLHGAQVLIDLTSDGRNHYLRFEEPTDRSRTTMAITHLTPSAVEGEVLGHHASVVIGWGQRVADATNVVNALKQEWKSGLVQSPEPGTVTVDGASTAGARWPRETLSRWARFSTCCSRARTARSSASRKAAGVTGISTAFR